MFYFKNFCVSLLQKAVKKIRTVKRTGSTVLILCWKNNVFLQSLLDELRLYAQIMLRYRHR